MTPPIDVPELVRKRALSNKVAGQRWRDELPDVVSELGDRWDLDIGRPLTGGTASDVVAATDGLGRPVVLKVAMPLAMHDAMRSDAVSRRINMLPVKARRALAVQLRGDGGRDREAVVGGGGGGR